MNFRSGLLVKLEMLAATTIMLALVASTATATITLTVVGTNLTTMSTDLTLAAVGDSVQLDVFMTNDNSFGIQAAAFQAYGFAPGSLTFTGGLAAADWFSKKLASGVPVKGLQNLAGTSNGTDGQSVPVPRTLSPANTAQVSLPDGSIQFYNGLTVGTPAVGNGSFDFGILDGGPGSLFSMFPNTGYTGIDGAAHARLIFTVVTTGETIGFGFGGATGSGTKPDASPFTAVDVNDASIQVPEPTSMAMGLAAMASVFTVTGLRRRGD